MILDKNDLTILPSLARDCRTSYRSIDVESNVPSVISPDHTSTPTIANTLNCPLEILDCSVLKN